MVAWSSLVLFQFYSKNSSVWQGIYLENVYVKVCEKLQIAFSCRIQLEKHF